MLRGGYLLLLIALLAGGGGGFVLDGMNLQFMPRSVRSVAEARGEVVTRLFARDNGWSGRAVVTGDMSRLRDAGWSPAQPSMVLIHGFSESDAVGCVPVILEAFRQTPSSANVFVVDWGSLAAGPWYYTARTNSEYVALVTARLLDFLTGPGGASAGSIHLVGCGLGARVAALAATNLNRPEKIGRLTGLDPWFGRSLAERQLATRAVVFVDAVHTDAGVLGHSEPVGHADFFPNGGTSPQPGCELAAVFRFTNMFSTALCSHSRAHQYFAESLRRPGAFLAVPCASWTDYRRRGSSCREATAVPMGVATPPSARGRFFLDTNSSPPFGKSRMKLPQLSLVPQLPQLDPRLPQLDPRLPQLDPKVDPRLKLEESRRKAGKSLGGEGRLWSHPGVNTLASFVRLAELNLVEQ